MKFTKIIVAAALVIGIAHVSEAQAIPSFNDFKTKAGDLKARAGQKLGKVAGTVQNSGFGKAVSGFAGEASSKLGNAGSAIRNSKVGQTAAGFAGKASSKLGNARNAIQGAFN